MIKEFQGNLFESPAQMRCVLVSHKSNNQTSLVAEAQVKYPGMVDELSSRCKLWGNKNQGDVYFYLAPDGSVCANMFADTDEKLKMCLKLAYEFAVRYGLTVGFPMGAALNGRNEKTVKTLISAIFKDAYAPIFYLVEHTSTTTTPVSQPANTDKKESKLPSVTIYTDGACSGNPGPGGWAAVMITGTHIRELSGGAPNTTNNQMELTGPIQALSLLKRPCSVTLYSDSQYLTKAFNEHWIENWQKNGWKTTSKKPVKNVDLWEQLIGLTQKHTVRFVWVKGHAENEYNIRCDELAVAESNKFK